MRDRSASVVDVGSLSTVFPIVPAELLKIHALYETNRANLTSLWDRREALKEVVANHATTLSVLERVRLDQLVQYLYEPILRVLDDADRRLRDRYANYYYAQVQYYDLQRAYYDLLRETQNLESALRTQLLAWALPSPLKGV